jgi:hypothetical protein
MKVMLVDPTAKTVTFADWSAETRYAKTKEYVGGDTDHFTVLTNLGNLFGNVYEYGLYERKDFFEIGNYPQPLGGKAVFVGLTPHEGDACDVPLNLSQAQEIVRFVDVKFEGEDIVEGPTEIFGRPAHGITVTPKFTRK